MPIDAEYEDVEGAGSELWRYTIPVPVRGRAPGEGKGEELRGTPGEGGGTASTVDGACRPLLLPKEPYERAGRAGV